MSIETIEVQPCITHAATQRGIDSPTLSPPFALPTARAAEWLAKHAPFRNAKQWSAWLRHNNRPARYVRYRVRTQRIGNTILFTMDELARVRNFELDHRDRNGYSLESIEFLVARTNQEGASAASDFTVASAPSN